VDNLKHEISRYVPKNGENMEGNIDEYESNSEKEILKEF
jgi:hypothetical protein